MKPTYRHLIKILSCSLAIIAVLLCSMYVPVKAAAPKVLDPMDYLSSVTHDGYGRSTYFMDIWDNPIYMAYNESTLVSTYHGGLDWGLDTSYSFYRLSVSPVGATSFTSNPEALINVSDFKTSAVLELKYSPQFRVYVYNAGNSDLTYTVKSNVVLYWYDKDFKFLSSSSSGTMTNTGYYGQPDFIWTCDLTNDMVIPENACYMVPRYTISFYHPTSGYIYRIQNTEYQNFTIMVRKDDVIENSITMQRMEGKIDDLHDKADELLTGSDEMQGASDDFSGTADNAQQDMDSALDQLEELPEANADDVDLTFDGLLNDKGFQKYANFFEFLVFDTLYVKMMVIVCTFIWVSTLLYGKRG